QEIALLGHKVSGKGIAAAELKIAADYKKLFQIAALLYNLLKAELLFS
ncbi:37085_t:CDS:2, partial [Gigaspora margarita]